MQHKDTRIANRCRHRRQASPQKRAEHIAESIAARIAEGRNWSLADYGLDHNPELAALVQAELDNN